MFFTHRPQIKFGISDSKRGYFPKALLGMNIYTRLLIIKSHFS